MNAAGPAVIRPYVYNATIQRVIDGDTIVANVDLGFEMWRMAQTFRLLGINAREHDQAGGPEATANLVALLPYGTAVRIASVKPDKYGNRYDATLYLLDGQDLSRHLINTGWAAPWDGHGERALAPWPRPN